MVEAHCELPRRATVAERIVCAYLAALPLLWAVGLILPLAMLTSLGLCALYVRSRRALSLAWPWFLVGLCQLISAAINLVDRGQPLWRLARHLLASYVIGWFVLGACVAIGASGLIRR